MVIKQITPEEAQRRVDAGEDPLDVTIAMYEQAAVMLSKGLDVDRDTLARDPICGTTEVPFCHDGCVLSNCGGPGQVCHLMQCTFEHDAKRPEEINEVIRELKRIRAEVKQDETIRT